MSKCFRKNCNREGEGFVHPDYGGNYCGKCAESSIKPMTKERFLIVIVVGCPQHTVEEMRFETRQECYAAFKAVRNLDVAYVACNVAEACEAGWRDVTVQFMEDYIIFRPERN